ncbi:hypothetical protein QUV83_10060 [Cellulomonas cellasea]|uniref:hypothetical protein n=1 Tax=Cellulomonas cellasea TaxID=43670 RepID=UPI0025A3C859|nr:hypothetical protein [Cellulomonas cellasea]MDM8085108.1 hypothetical protein [Cellulomonas cellasea]
MRALSCLDAGTSFERIDEVARAAGMDAVVIGDAVATNPELCAQLEESRLRVVLNLPLLFDPELLARRPETLAVTSTGGRASVGWLQMACPRSEDFWTDRSDVLRTALAAVRPDMVSLDFARTFVFWERVGPDTRPEQIEHGCWCPRCLDGLEPPADREELGRRAAQAVTARIGQAVDLVRESHPDVPIGVKVVPWRMADYDGAREWACGQDLSAIAPLVDFLMPMSYSALIGRPPAYLREMHRELRETAGRPLMPWLQAAALDGSDPLPVDEIAAMLDAIEHDAELGYCVFHLDGIADRPDVLKLLATRAPTSNDVKEIV